jgi:DNA-binding transcriptional MerR regulator
MQLAWSALRGPWPGTQLRQSALALVCLSASGDLGGALEEAYHYLALVRAERAQAEGAVAFLERWADGVIADSTDDLLRIGQAAQLLGVTTDMLRNWERNGLVAVPRDRRNGYRLYGAAEIGRLRVIRMLRRAKYSVMSILRMLIHLDRGHTEDLRAVLDTPRPDEDAYTASDRWLSTLSDLEDRALGIISQLERMIVKQDQAVAPS